MGKYEKAAEELEELEQTLRQQEARETKEKEQKARLETKKKFSAITVEKESDAAKLNIKLPKLVVTKFHGMHLHSKRFWGQFKEEIDKSNIGQVAKFSYLKKLLVPRVGAIIEGSPFNREGYTQTKNILMTK